MTNNSYQGTDIDWEGIIESIENNKCVLFLGPYIYSNEKGEILENIVSEKLDVRNPDHPHIHSYYEDGFYLFKEKRYKNRYIRSLRTVIDDFYPEVKELLSKIAQIPFNLIILLTPDSLLQRAFSELQLPFIHDFYFKNQNPSSMATQIDKIPLIYNILGHLETYESLILTHEDLFEFLKSIFREKSMHENLKAKLFNAEQYIFLGLPFEKWYMQLLLRILYLYSDKREHIEQLATKPVSEIKNNMYVDQFKIEFLSDETRVFINKLHSICAVREILRSSTQVNSKVNELNIRKGEIYKLISINQIERAFEATKYKLEVIQQRDSEDLLGNLLILMSNFTILKERVSNGTISEADQSLQRNQIIHNFLQIITKLED